MDIWISAEIDANALVNFNKIRLRCEALINEELGKSELSDLDLHIRYIPIVMINSALEEYPTRSKFYGNVLLSAPQIEYGVFLSGDRILDQIQVFFAGLRKDLDLVEIDLWNKKYRIELDNILMIAENTLINEEITKK